MLEENIKQKHKFNNGITLIALIITIIVMLILVALTLVIALGEDGVITKTINAKEEHEIAAFKECVEIAAKGNFDPNYYWGEDINLSGKYNYRTIQREIREKYPNATFSMLIMSMPGAPIGTMTEKELEIQDGQVVCAQKTLEYLDNNEWSSRLTTAERNKIETQIQKYKQDYIDELKKIYESEGRINEFNLTTEDIDFGLGTSDRVSILRIGPVAVISMMGFGSTMIVENEGITATVGFVNTNLYDYYIVMKKSEAEKIFEFTYYTEDDMLLATVKQYKGNSKEVKVPGTLIDDEDGKAIPVTGIDDYAFTKTNLKYSLINLLTERDFDDTDYDEILYNETATLAEFKAFFDAPEDIYYCEHTELGDSCTSKLCKNELLKVGFVMMAEEAGIDVTADNINDFLTVDSENTLYIYIRVDVETGMLTPITPAEYQESNTREIIVSEGIQTIGESFVNCGKLEKIYIPSTTDKLSSYAFQECVSLTEMTTMNEDIAKSNSKYGCPNENFVKVYIEQTGEIN